MIDDLWVDVGRVNLEDTDCISDICIGAFSCTPLAAMYTYEVLCIQ